MNKLCVVPLLVLLVNCIARAQDAVKLQAASDPSATEALNSAPAISADSGTGAAVFADHAVGVTSPSSLWLPGFPKAPAAPAFAVPAFAKGPEPTPAAPSPRFVFGGRDDFRWQLGLGVSLLRFRSPFYYATGVGSDTSVTYFTNDWFGFEGRATTAFAPTIGGRDHVKFVGYGGGPKLAWRAQRFEPFVHTLFGGMHILPKTADNNPNGLEFQIGGGAGYRFNPRLSARIVVDWVRTYIFGEWEHNAQASLQAVLHF